MKYIADWRPKGYGEPFLRASRATFEQAQAMLEKELVHEADASGIEDFVVAAGYAAFEQKPFAYTVNGIEVSIYQIGE